MSQLDFKVDQKIFKDLLEFRRKLPMHATGGTKEGAMETHDHPAGLALLGETEGLVDMVVPLKMSGGCWDAPNINYKDMDIGFRALIKTGRRCVGMAFVRHPRWGSGWDMPRYEAKMSHELRYAIHGMKNSFADISNTLWIVMHKDNFRFFKPALSIERRMTISEVKVDSKIETSEEPLDPFIVAKLERDRKSKEAAAKAKLTRLAKKAAIEEERKKKLMTEKERLDCIDRDLKEGKKETIEIGNGLSYVKNHEGNYIVWQTGRQ